MKLLESYFKHNSDFHLKLRRGDFGIFHGRDRTNGTDTFELIMIRQGKERTVTFTDKKTGEKKPVHISAAEFPPSDNEWGDAGWTFPTLEAAEARLAIEVAKHQAKPSGLESEV